VPLDARAKTEIRRRGFMQGQGTVPDDFDEIARGEIERLFSGGPQKGAIVVDAKDAASPGSISARAACRFPIRLAGCSDRRRILRSSTNRNPPWVRPMTEEGTAGGKAQASGGDYDTRVAGQRLCNDNW
jgi:hypothetical protein